MKYTVYGYLTISVFKEIEADSEEAAREAAKNLATPSLCHQCSNAGSSEDGAWELNEFDEPPADAVIDVEESD